MICPSGHRVIDSTGAHWTLLELEPGLYRYHVGECEELEPDGTAEAEEQPSEQERPE